VPGELFTGMFVPERVQEATSDRAWLQAMLDAEAALAASEAEAGLIPGKAAEAIGAACDAGDFDLEAIGLDSSRVAVPVVPLVRALRDRLDDETAGYAHYGATSQDIMDTAAMLVGRRALAAIDQEVDGVAAACAALAEEHRVTLIAGRTLLQHGLPTTFGLKAAGWLDSVVSARARLGSVSLAVQFGGAAGTLASLGEGGDRVIALMAKRLELEDPAIPWHTARLRVADLGASLALMAGALEKIALDVVLLSQTEVGEVAEPSGGGRGGSSTLPHKRNAVGSVLAIASARRVRGAAGVLLAAMPQELAMTGGAAGAVRDALDGLEVRADRMRENLGATGGLLMAESVVASLGERVGRGRARELVDAASGRALDAGTPLREQLVGDPGVSAELSEQEIDRALDPAGYLGSADAFIDRALSRYRGDRGR
jgi:3-carboxy-cis,cis-muconate cycloisomerase